MKRDRCGADEDEDLVSHLLSSESSSNFRLSCDQLEVVDAAVAVDEKPRVEASGIESESQMRRAFRVFDVDDSGTIDSSELVALIQDLAGESIEEGDVERLARAADTNGDGHVTFEEFCSLMRAHERLVRVTAAVQRQRHRERFECRRQWRSSPAVGDDKGGERREVRRRTNTSSPQRPLSLLLPPLCLPPRRDDDDEKKRDKKISIEKKDSLHRRTPHSLRDDAYRATASSSLSTIRRMRKDKTTTDGYVAKIEGALAEDVQWIRKHLPVTQIRARLRFRKRVASLLERMSVRMKRRRLASAMDRWIQDAERKRCRAFAERFLRSKGALKIVATLRRVIRDRLAPAFSTWVALTESRRFAEELAAASVLQRGARASLARWRLERRRRGRAAARVQSAWRFYAKYRLARTLLFDFLPRDRAVGRIQRAWRAHAARTLVERMRERRAAIAVQCLFRRSSAARSLAQHRETRRKNVAANRARLAWRLFARRRENRLRESAVVQLQTIWRGRVGRVTLRELVRARDRDIAERDAAATRLQCAFRSRQARDDLADRQLAREKTVSATLLQCTFRSRRARDELARRRHVRSRADFLRRRACARIIVRHVRRFAKCARLKRFLAARSHEEIAATKIQAIVRRHLVCLLRRPYVIARVRVRREDVRLREERIAKAVAALDVQRTARGYLGRQIARRRRKEVRAGRALLYAIRNFTRRRRQSRAATRARETSATIIQASFRGRRARERRRAWAATTLQRSFRGLSGRLVTRAMRAARAAAAIARRAAVWGFAAATRGVNASLPMYPSVARLLRRSERSTYASVWRVMWEQRERNEVEEVQDGAKSVQEEATKTERTETAAAFDVVEEENETATETEVTVDDLDMNERRHRSSEMSEDGARTRRAPTSAEIWRLTGSSKETRAAIVVQSVYRSILARREGTERARLRENQRSEKMRLKRVLKSHRLAARHIQRCFRWKRRQRLLLRLRHLKIPLKTVIIVCDDDESLRRRGRMTSQERKQMEAKRRKEEEERKRRERKKLGDPQLWIECWDKKARSTFYYHPRLETSTWDEPEGFVPKDVSPLCESTYNMRGFVYDLGDKRKEHWEVQMMLREDGETVSRIQISDDIAAMATEEGGKEEGETGDDSESRPRRNKSALTAKQRAVASSRSGLNTSMRKTLNAEERYIAEKRAEKKGGTTTRRRLAPSGVEMLVVRGRWRREGHIEMNFLRHNVELSAERRRRLQIAARGQTDGRVQGSTWEFRFSGRITAANHWEGAWTRREIVTDEEMADRERRAVQEILDRGDARDEERARAMVNLGSDHIESRGGRFSLSVIAMQVKRVARAESAVVSGLEAVLRRKSSKRVYRDGKWQTICRECDASEMEDDASERTICTICRGQDAQRRCLICTIPREPGSKAPIQHHALCLACWDQKHRSLPEPHEYSTLNPNECVECSGAARAEVACEQCGDRFCFPCYKRCHATPARRSHTFKRLRDEMLDTGNSGEGRLLKCDQCETATATRYCKQCEDRFCETCFAAIHRKGKRRKHVTQWVNGFVGA